MYLTVMSLRSRKFSGRSDRFESFQLAGRQAMKKQGDFEERVREMAARLMTALQITMPEDDDEYENEWLDAEDDTPSPKPQLKPKLKPKKRLN